MHIEGYVYPIIQAGSFLKELYQPYSFNFKQGIQV